ELPRRYQRRGGSPASRPSGLRSDSARPTSPNAAVARRRSRRGQGLSLGGSRVARRRWIGARRGGGVGLQGGMFHQVLAVHVVLPRSFLEITGLPTPPQGGANFAKRLPMLPKIVRGKVLTVLVQPPSCLPWLRLGPPYPHDRPDPVGKRVDEV